MNEYTYLCETQSRIIKLLEAENTKLRELVRDMWQLIRLDLITVYPSNLTTSIRDRVRKFEI